MAKKQEYIINVAAKFFSKRGVAATAMRDIAEEAGISHSLINYYFRSKEKLLKEFIREGLNKTMGEVQRVMKKQGPESEKISSLIELYVNYIFSNRELALISFQEQLASSYPNLAKLFLKLNKKNRTYFTLIIEHGQENKTFRQDVNPELIYSTIIGTKQQHIVTSDYYSKNSSSVLSVELTDYLKEKIMIIGNFHFH